jgi:hypothetical protein
LIALTKIHLTIADPRRLLPCHGNIEFDDRGQPKESFGHRRNKQMREYFEPFAFHAINFFPWRHPR